MTHVSLEYAKIENPHYMSMCFKKKEREKPLIAIGG